MSPGGDCRFCYRRFACLQVGTATFVIIFWVLCVHVSRWGLSLLLSSVCMSPGGDCRLRHRILGALRTCLQVGTVAFVIVGLHVSRWGLPPSSSYSGGSVYMSPGGDRRFCYRRLACLQVGTAAFVIIFWGLCIHVSRWGLPPSSSYSGCSAYMSPGGDCRFCYRRFACLQVGTATFVIVFWGLFVHVSRWRLSLSLSLARMSPGGECCLCYRILPLNARRFLMLSITA